MLGLDGFVLLAVSEYAAELEQAVETTAVEDFCRVCGVQARLHDRRPSWVRDLPSGGRPVTLVWVKRVWRCMQGGCPASTWTETHPAIRARASLTERARVEACRRVGQDGHSVAQVAATPSVPSHRSVWTGPGLTLLIRTPRGAYSLGSDLHRLARAPFAAQ